MAPQNNNGPATEPSDEALMLLVQKGNEPAFNALYKRYAARLYAFLIKMLGHDTERAQDMLQDIFLLIAEHPEKFNPEKSFYAWVFTIAANRCRNEYRNQHTRQDILQSLGIISETVSASVYTNHDLQQFRKRLYELMDAMSEASRLLWLLRFQQDLPVSRIAQIMGLPEGTVKSRLYYLVKELSGKLKIYHPYK